jgi:cardiolipin synthase A/B
MLPLSPRLIVEPDDGLDPVREFINSAQNSLLIKQFTFTEPSLIAAAIERKMPTSTCGCCSTRRSSSKFYVTHEKSTVVNEKAALVATFNLMEK